MPTIGRSTAEATGVGWGHEGSGPLFGLGTVVGFVQDRWADSFFWGGEGVDSMRKNERS